MLLNQLICSDCVSGMKSLPSDSVHLTVTSPPWDNMRSFKGNRLSWEKFCVIAAELYRITCDGGVVCWHYGEQIKAFAESLTSRRQLMYFVDGVGFTCHKTLITETTNGNHGRSEQYGSLQYVYVLSKGRPRTINVIRDIPNKTFGDIKRYTKYGKEDCRKVSELKEMPEYRVRGPVWRYHCGTTNATEKFVREGHPATMPELLARDLIYSFSRESNLVFDPFAGAGTTLKMASALGRHYLGFEIVPEFAALGCRRLRACL
ncbi:hypothetical protein GC163_12645 [bacterium]|nr:hypothetical protein [bacterium]